MRTIFKTRFVSTAVRKESRRDSKTLSEIVAENREQQRKMEVDSDYEFNAPKYIDFLSNEAENEYIDTWFDENPDGHEGGIRISQVPFICQHSNFQAATRAISAALNGTDSMHPDEKDVGEAFGSNDCKTEQSKATENVQKTEAEVANEIPVTEDVLQNDEVEGKNEKLDEVSNDNGEKQAEREVAEAESKDENAAQRITRSQTPNKGKRTPLPALRKRKHSLNQKGSASKNNVKANADKKVDAKKPKLDMKKPLITMPNTPSFLRRLRGKSNGDKKTSEALEIERIKALQEETKKRLKENESSLQKVLAPQTILQTKKALDVTKTMEFTFATDSRIKQHPMQTRGDRPRSGDFAGQLRKHPPSPTFKNKKLTKPQPFKFSTDGKATKQQSALWKSVASSVSDFQNKTPERWRSRPANQQNNGPEGGNKNKVKLEITNPITPQLNTKKRTRPSVVQSQSDIESKVVEEMTSYKFKAREFDHKLVELNGMCGVDQKKHLPVTEPKPFSFQSDSRLEHRKKLDEEKKEKEKALKQQHQLEHVTEKRNTSVDSNNGQKKKQKLTEPKPFSFENRDKEMMQKKQEKILKVYEEEEKAREFHARPLPRLSPDLIPVKSGKHTDFAPFNLATDQRGAIKEEKWNAQLMHERENEKEMSSFKAKPCKVVHQEGFKIKAAPRPLTEISEFKLNTEERSRKRESYEIMKKELQRVKEDEIQQTLKERQEEEAREIAVLRKHAVHKANPVRQFGEFEIKPSKRPLTMPATPNFETNKRLGKLSRV